MKQSHFNLYKKYMYFIGYAGQIIYITQAYKILQTKSSADVSLVGFAISLLAVASWATYGYLIGDKLLIKTYSFGTIAAFICLIIIIIYS
ncbi:hypothetical protein A3J41_00060 [candidate division TM6 bacterium RIFCSPHIGHO2_12_FULL_38_8]|nr:MAG: hypothetical protein A3J41_00060 [candidate division TM6 bacterium RIFCSPHIGHO2_12_FULL_38_8]